MRLLRIPVTLALSALTAVALAVPAQAAGCPMLTDVAGDGTWGLVPLVSSPQLDIRSGDVASGATTVVAVLRMTSLVDNLYSQLGPQWGIAWSINGNSYSATLRRGAGPVPSYIATFQSPSGTSTPAWSYDLGTGVITWTMPRSALPDLATPGQTFSNLRAQTALLSGSADQAFASSATYVDQTAGCVPAS
jgi:hypothetical protein